MSRPPHDATKEENYFEVFKPGLSVYWHQHNEQIVTRTENRMNKYSTTWFTRANSEPLLIAPGVHT